MELKKEIEKRIINILKCKYKETRVANIIYGDDVVYLDVMQCDGRFLRMGFHYDCMSLYRLENNMYPQKELKELITIIHNNLKQKDNWNKENLKKT